MAITLLVTGTTPAFAEPGSLTLYKGAIAVSTTEYAACTRPVESVVAEQVDAYTNSPISGCQAVLINRVGDVLRLCAGHHALPAAFRSALHVRIARGVTPPICTTE
ncbi:MAG TPA: hypothetical protein VFV66_11630 [Nonomuraea sp.]|nr:hypothetical protein [Nonomuraea sp.]